MHEPLNFLIGPLDNVAGSTNIVVHCVNMLGHLTNAGNRQTGDLFDKGIGTLPNPETTHHRLNDHLQRVDRLLVDGIELLHHLAEHVFEHDAC